MDKEYIVKLTNELYQLTLLFPKKEPLRYRIREVANDIMADLLVMLNEKKFGCEDLAEKITKNALLLDSFLDVAKNQNWVERKEMQLSQDGYRVIAEEMQRFHQEQKSQKKVVETPVSEAPRPVFSLASLNTRQKKILDLLKERDGIQVGEVQEILPQITKRTIRRDFEMLLSMQVVERVGERSETFYRLADRTL